MSRLVPGDEGFSKTSEAKIFHRARHRCTSPNCKEFKNYGGRGIEFRFETLAEFFAEVGHRPQGKTLDRINNDGHYEKGNLRWATWEQQAANRRPHYTAKVYPLECGIAPISRRWGKMEDWPEIIKEDWRIHVENYEREKEIARMGGLAGGNGRGKLK